MARIGLPGNPGHVEQKNAGTRIRQLRDQRAWTQEDLAHAAGVSVRTVQRAEDGAMSADTLRALARALDESVEAVLEPPARYPSVTPVVYYDDPNTLTWLERVFGFAARMKIPGPDGRIVHAELTYGDGLIMVGCPVPSAKWLTPRQLDGAITQCVYVVVDDVDAHYARTRDAGAEVLGEPADAHGQRRYQVKDPEGHLWWFVQEL